MSDCCTPGSGFPNAALMQQMATNNSVVWKEICMLQQAVLEAASQCQIGGGKMCVTVGGNTPMTFISGVENIEVIDGGAGYFIDTPAVYFEPPNGAASVVPATGIVTTNGTGIMSINIIDGGSGYQPIKSTLSVSSISGTNAILEPLVNAVGQIVSVNIIDAGTGYTTADSVIATRAVAADPAYVNATFLITSVSVTGEILSVIVTNPGSGYQDSVTTAKIVSTLNPNLNYPLGTGFMSVVSTDSMGTITSVIISNTGQGYADFNPYAVISDPGTGATTAVQLIGNSVSTVAVTKAGNNYTQNATATVVNPPTASAPNPLAILTVHVSNNTFGTDPSLYWQVWSGTAVDKQISIQLNSVISYFKGLGYTIIIQSNPASTNTIQWKICW